jgi:acetyl esterase/lipase
MVPRLLALVAIPLLAAATLADPPAPPPIGLPVRVTKGVTFATAGGESLKLDLAAPTAGGPYPAVVLFHGGAWQMGSRTDLSTASVDLAARRGPSVIEAVAAHGYVVASAGYRLAPKHPFPAQIDDARAAVRFLRDNARTYRLDPDRIAAGGFSAGGHLALLLALNPPPPAAGGSSAAVKCAVSYFGPTDLNLYQKSPGIEDVYIVPFLGKECRTDPEVYRKASPITFASKAAPPILMIHGTADLVVPIIHSERLLGKLREAGATAELMTVPGAGHGWSGPDAARSTAAAVRFLDRQLKDVK